MGIGMITGLLGGLALFLYGMRLMGDSLQKAAGDRMKHFIEILTTNKVMGVFVGIVVTGIIQSSSATTVMVVGFVNAGLMTLEQAVGVIMGANIGTTVTAQLIAFKLSDIAPLAVAIGVAIWFFSPKKSQQQVGEVIIGFGILFMGMELMSSSVKPLKDVPEFTNLILILGHNKFLGVLVGLLMTSVVQSSSVTIGILQALAFQGLVPIEVALPVLFGDNIGTTVTALLSSIGANKTARRAALVHTFFNIIGTIIFMIILGPVTAIVKTTSADVARQIANAHTLFNVTNTVIQLPFSNYLVKLVKYLIPGDVIVEEKGLKYLDERILETPSIAVVQAYKEVIRMGYISLQNLKTSMEAFFENDSKKCLEVFERERYINQLESEITKYLVEIANASLSPEQSKKITSMFHIVNDIERIGDHADNIAELAQYSIENRLKYSNAAISELRGMTNIAYEAVEEAISVMKNPREDFYKNVLELEKEIDRMEKVLRDNHIIRLNKGECEPSSGVVYLDLLSNLERIGDHSANIVHMAYE
ncbi:Na/Pi cotransporter family protein [Calorimonas adulescens]|jgi:Na/Pi-cotransporter|uniref:Na/Pi cotransporter family protein n=1 Tax=Calorimonas adulescens TaxID=2606906 RepID=A0A5D8Q8T0_9THEO|nr:Na/Pi cotransporter family protein [Calorimonas adulescens]TZE80892.1 Na/Pi cotransporter family protein [Calorimonas adulescens]